MYFHALFHRLPLNISTQMFSGYDVPVLLIEILLDKPWFKSGKLYSGGKWMKPSDEALGQAEAQVCQNIVYYSIIHKIKQLLNV